MQNIYIICSKFTYIGSFYEKSGHKNPEMAVYEWTTTVLVNPSVISISCLKCYLMQ